MSWYSDIAETISHGDGHYGIFANGHGGKIAHRDDDGSSPTAG
jgi:hypothetical protein